MTTKAWAPICAAIVATAMSFTAGSAGGQEETKPVSPKAGEATAQETADSQAEAKAILTKMASFLSGTPRFSVNIRSGYDTVQESGEKIEFNEIRKVTVSRPDRLRIEIEQSDGDKNLFVFDGKDLTLSTPSKNVYAQVSRPGDIDGAIRYFLQDLHMRLPLAALVTNQFPAEMERRVQSIDYVEQTSILGKPAHHLAGRTESVDFQVWVADGAQPLPLRVVLTYKNDDGQPQYRAMFSDWNLAPKVSDAMFAFAPPAAAKKISFLSELKAAAVPQPAANK